MTGARLFRVILPSLDFESDVAFFSALLVQVGRRVSPGRHYFGCGTVVLALVNPRADGDEWDTAANRDHVYFAVDDLAALRKTAILLLGNGAVSEIETQPWGETTCYFSDPSGNPLCFIQAGSEFTGDVLATVGHSLES